MEEYSLHKLSLFVDRGEEKVEVNLDQSLRDVLSDNDVLIAGGVPTFEVYVKGSGTYVSHVLGGG